MNGDAHLTNTAPTKLPQNAIKSPNMTDDELNNAVDLPEHMISAPPNEPNVPHISSLVMGCLSLYILSEKL